MLHGTFDDWLEREWLLTNGRGGFACSTIVGCPTRREHGWMVWNVPGPRLERWMLWSHAAESLQIDGRTTLLANFEFNNAIDPHGYRHLTSVEVTPDEAWPCVTWTYALEGVTVTRRLAVPPQEDIVVVRYQVRCKSDAEVRLQVWPMIAGRPLTHLRRKAPGEVFQMSQDGAAIGLRYQPDGRIGFVIVGRPMSGQPTVEFQPRGDWWYNFRYRREAERGLEFGEDLMVPGAFHAGGRGGLDVELVGVGGTHDVREALRRIQRLETGAPVTTPSGGHTVVRFNGAASGLPMEASLPETTHALQTVARPFVFRQPHVSGPPRIGIVAGYPWLEEYSRDACVSIPGLLLVPGRYDEARELLLQLALLRRDGALPTHLTDEPGENDYVNADAALWFVHAVDAYLSASGDHGPAVAELLKASYDIVRALVSGVREGMRVDADGLLICEDAARAATWMDARYAWHFITPRTGKPVEVNALWYHVLCVLAQRLDGVDRTSARECQQLSEHIRVSFSRTFWNEATRGLYDVVRPGESDPAIRPNQIFAVSLPHSALSASEQVAVVRLVQDRLLTPMGLRSLAAGEPEYCGRYEGSVESREHAAHEGSIYSWLIGPFVDAYLRVHGNTPAAKVEARAMLQPVIDHLSGPGGVLGISELFDGEPPHKPRGSITQAWSAAEVVRAWAMTTPDQGAAPSATVSGGRAATIPAARRP